MIEKPSIIITSAGRTGTAFFFELFKNILKDSKTFHEPENINFKEISETLWKFKKFGIFNTTVKKIKGKWGITAISNRRMSREITVDEGTKLLINERKKFVESFNESIYVEASYHYYGLLDVLPNVFRRHKAIYIIRDGREWVRSHMNKLEWYHEKNPHTKYNTRISPMIFNDDEYNLKWNSMSRFEKLCWAWAKINNYAFSSVKKNPNAQLYYFEDIFLSKKKYEKLQTIVDFLTDIPNHEKIQYNALEGILDKKINKPPTYKFPHWREWSQEQLGQFNEICGSVMEKLGY